MSGNLRLRVFAGPNGSGKSTIINAVRTTQVAEANVDFGIYVNADDIASDLKIGVLKFKIYDITADYEDFIKIALESGLIGERFPQKVFIRSFSFANNTIRLLNPEKVEHLSQVLADYLRKKLLTEKKKFSLFETVFSHKGKIDIMRQAAQAGYKVYLYFVCTENPDINIYRVKEVRVKQGGHDVPELSIRNRYFRSLELLHEAAQTTYRTYFFDNSKETYKLFADFKKSGNHKEWTVKEGELPGWFMEYYSQKN